MSGLRLRVQCFSCIVLLCVLCSAAVAQLGAQMYGLAGEFGMGTPVPSRVLAMGGPISCVKDAQFANPAFAGAQERSSAGVRAGWTDFDNGPNLDSVQGHVTVPLRTNRQGLQVTMFTMQASDDPVTLFGFGPTVVQMSEDALVVDYGQRLGDQWLVGLSVLGYERVGLSLAPPVGPAFADIDDDAEYGARIGAAYEWYPGDFIGLLVSFSKDDVDATGVALLGGPGHRTFHSSQLALGASRHLGKLLAALEFQRGVLSHGDFKSTSDSWRLGGEYQATRHFAPRLGFSDGDITFGFGWADDHWRADYAFIQNWNDEDIRGLFGGSETHSLEVMFSW